MYRHLLPASTTFVLPATALAHGGHVGELAGHSHWLGLAALAGAVAVTAIAAKLRSRRNVKEAEAADAEAETSR